MQTFGRMRLDVDNCLRELVAFGLTRRAPGSGTPRYGFTQPDSDTLRDLLDQFLERRATVTHEDRSPSVQRFREMIGRDEKMLVVFEWIRTAAKSDISVLILGPTGSGKEVVARMIHELSRRGTNKFQAVNCAALPDTLFESEIFGYEKGAFTGAHDRKPGRLELANNGTLFLDEIGDLSIIAQAKLLRVLEERRFERLGGNTSIEVNFRLISATNRPLDQFVRDSRFREDLYYRVNAFSIRLPSLRERASDIPVLAQRFLARYCAANGLQLDGKSFAKDASDLLMQYHWPGNIRELESTVSRAALSSPGRVIRAADIEFLHASETPIEASRERLPSLAEAERAHILRVLESANWNKKQAAGVLEISRGTLYRKIVEYGLERESKPSRNRTRPAGN
jgi:DNA-binding NtrC family response regulator